MCESVAVLPGGDDHVVAGVGPADHWAGASVGTDPELVCLQASLSHSVRQFGFKSEKYFLYSEKSGDTA